jgi:hypothetical protein
MANIPVLEKVVQAMKERDMEGNISLSSHNSFSILQDEVIVSKALEIGIDASSLPMKTMHMLKDLEIARDNLAKKKPIQISSSVICIQPPTCGKIVGVDAKSDDNPTHEEIVSGEDDDFTPVISREKRMAMKKKSSDKK